MHLHLGGEPHAMTTINAIYSTGNTHDTEPNYGSFLSYKWFSGGYYVTLGKWHKEPIAGYINTLLRLVGEVNDKKNVFHVSGLRSPLYFLCQHRNLPHCGYIVDNKGTHMWLTSFVLPVDDRVDNILSYDSMGRPYIIIKRNYNQPRHKAETNASLPTTNRNMISQE